MVGKSPSITQWFSRFNDLNIYLVGGLPVAIPPSFECRRSCPVRTGEMTQDSPEINLFSRWKLTFFANKLVNHRTKWAIVSMTILYLQLCYQKAMNFVEHHARIGILWPNLFVMKCWCQWFLATSWSSCHVISWAGDLQGPWCGLTGWLVVSDQMHPLLNFFFPIKSCSSYPIEPLWVQFCWLLRDV